MNQNKHLKIGKKRRKQIIRVATRLMSKKGYKGTSLQEIANFSDIHKTTLFHYFKNKEELLLAVMEMGINEVTDNLILILDDKQLSPKEKLEQAIKNHIQSLTEYIDNVNVFHSDIRYLPAKNKTEFMNKRERYESLFEHIIDDMKKEEEGYFRDLDSKLVTYGILGMCNWVSKWYKKGGMNIPEEISRVFYRIIMDHTYPQ